MSFQMMKNRVTVYLEIVYWGGFSFWGKMDPFFSSFNWDNAIPGPFFREECQIPGLCFRRGIYLCYNTGSKAIVCTKDILEFLHVKHSIVHILLTIKF